MWLMLQRGKTNPQTETVQDRTGSVNTEAQSPGSAERRVLLKICKRASGEGSIWSKALGSRCCFPPLLQFASCLIPHPSPFPKQQKEGQENTMA